MPGLKTTLSDGIYETGHRWHKLCIFTASVNSRNWFSVVARFRSFLTKTTESQNCHSWAVASVYCLFFVTCFFSTTHILNGDRQLRDWFRCSGFFGFLYRQVANSSSIQLSPDFFFAFEQNQPGFHFFPIPKRTVGRTDAVTQFSTFVLEPQPAYGAQPLTGLLFNPPAAAVEWPRRPRQYQKMVVLVVIVVGIGRRPRPRRTSCYFLLS